MKSILHDFYFGRINPCERQNVPESKYKDIIKKLDEGERYLTSRLSKDDCQHFQDFKKLLYQATSIDEVEVFKIGYKLGALMVMEITNDRGQ